MKVPFVNLALQHQLIKEELLEAAGRVFDHGQFILGPEVLECEKQFALLCGTKFAVGVDNGTSALFLILRALGIGPGDEVITAPNSFMASASCAILIGAKPVFVDVGRDYTLDPSKLEKAITPRTKAIIPVHWTGHSADMDAINAIAKKHNLPVIEDAAQAVGASYKGRPVGSLSKAATFSLHPLKNLSACGDGGMITTHDEELYHTLLLARNHGLRDRDHCAFWSFNCRLDTLQAALLLTKIPRLAAWNKARREHAAFYKKHLSDIPALELPYESPDVECVFHTFIIQTDRRDELKAFLKEQGVDSVIHYPIPIHLQEAAKELGYKEGDFPVTERQAKRILSLPVYPELTPEQRQHVVDSVRRFYSAK
jgi:dTDP-4-amino-4,6-dideoxygalactose transaminase